MRFLITNFDGARKRNLARAIALCSRRLFPEDPARSTLGSRNAQGPGSNTDFVVQSANRSAGVRPALVDSRKISMSRQRLSWIVLVSACFAVAGFGIGCARVAPYERGTLAHPTMSTEDFGSPLDAHVRDVMEGANGGLSGGGGGCGCN
jgi:hypothetical protein